MSFEGKEVEEAEKQHVYGSHRKTCSFIHFTSEAATKAAAHLFTFSQGCVDHCSAAKVEKETDFLLMLLILLSEGYSILNSWLLYTSSYFGC